MKRKGFVKMLISLTLAPMMVKASSYSRGQSEQRYCIDHDLCIRCGTCNDNDPNDIIYVDAEGLPWFRCGFNNYQQCRGLSDWEPEVEWYDDIIDSCPSGAIKRTL